MTPALTLGQDARVEALEQTLIGTITVVQVNGGGLSELHASIPSGINAGSIDALSMMLMAEAEIKTCHLSIERTHLVMTIAIGNFSGKKRDKAIDSVIGMIKQKLANQTAMDVLGF